MTSPAMPTPVDSSPLAATARPREGPRAGTIKSLREMTKPGITRLVTITAAVGFAMAFLSTDGGKSVLEPSRPWIEIAYAGFMCAAGTYFSAAGANVLNQLVERSRDAKMKRTMRRPLPEERIAPPVALTFGVSCVLLGALVLALGCGAITTILALACTVTYLFAYTPMKPRSALSTYVGTFPGALPPLMGWAAGLPEGGMGATGAEHWPMWWGGVALFVLMTVWQLPHSFALAWMYRDDYAKGGYKLLPTLDPTGSKTSTTIAVWAFAQIPATLLPVLAMPNVLGWPYAAIAVLTGLWYFVCAMRVLKTRSVADARKVFFVSIMHLPLLLIAMVVEAGIRRL
ncbi:MAG: protoheme IX farnesyltransferase [Tepidisphaera sp.]